MPTARVIGTPGVVKLIGFRDGGGTIEDEEIQMLEKLAAAGASPYKGPVSGNRVRIKNGLLEDVTGTVVDRKGKSRLVITVAGVKQLFAIEVDMKDMELI